MPFLGENNGWQQYIRWFKHSDIVCKCGCGTDNIAFEIMWLADRLREKYAELLFDKYQDADGRLVVVSGCRCPQHNIAVKGSEYSYHISIPEEKECKALDLRPPIHTEEQNKRNLAVFAEAVKIIKPPGYKIYSSWIHVDFRHGLWR